MQGKQVSSLQDISKSSTLLRERYGNGWIKILFCSYQLLDPHCHNQKAFSGYSARSRSQLCSNELVPRLSDECYISNVSGWCESMKPLRRSEMSKTPLLGKVRCRKVPQTLLFQIKFVRLRDKV